MLSICNNSNMKNKNRVMFQASLASLILIFLTLLFISCGHQKTQIHLHDRHVLSYDLVKSYAEKEGPLTLVLLDYHHDIRPEIVNVTSVNWVGKLVEENYVKKVIWLSGKKLLLPNRNSRMAWLERSLKNTYPETADKMRQAVQLVDWDDLQALELSGPFAITLDFDVFTKDPGDPPELFVDELCSWIQKQKPELVTLAFSAAYQPKPDKGWAWLLQFAQAYKTGSDWFLESGEFGEKFESNDEALAWEQWRKNPAKYCHVENPFYSGAYFWQNAPRSFVDIAMKKKLSAGNERAGEIISYWKNKEYRELEEKFTPVKMQELCHVAEAAREDFFAGADFAAPEQNSKSSIQTYGIAVRFRNAEEDRGCLSLYEGVAEKDLLLAAQFCAKEALVDPRYLNIRLDETAELFTNISIFGKWQEMTGPFDFEPGLDSLILVDESGEKTLLQAAIALERNYTREEFLVRLSNKAGLGFDGWKKNALHFYRAQTITYTD